MHVTSYFGLRKYDHVTEALMELHWLPIRSRIDYKIALITYKTLHGDGPEYLKEMLTPMQNRKSLRSMNGDLLKLPKSKLKSGGDRCFSVAAPRIWNSLPRELKSRNLSSFKSGLKTFLFKKAYRC